MKTNRTNKEIIHEMKLVQKWTEQTTRQIQTITTDYCNYQGMTLEELLREAEEDEENNLKIKKRRIKTRLHNYTLHLLERKLENSTILLYLAKIKQVYIYYDIEIPELHLSLQKNRETYTDIITRREIQRAVENASLKMKAVITTLVSSGLRRSDLCALRVEDFVEAVVRDPNCNVRCDDNLPLWISQVEQYDILIPEFHLISQKTRTDHITFCSQEATMYTLQMLRERCLKRDVQLCDSLFELKVKSVTANFERLSDRLGFERKRTRRRFHPHALRSFFATTLTTNDVDYLSTEFLLGHRLGEVQSSYYHANPRKLRGKYVRILDKLTFASEVSFVDLSRDEKRELEALREQNESMRRRLYDIEETIDLLRSRV